MNQFWDLSNRFFGHFGASFGRLCAKISSDPNLNLIHKAPKNGPKSHFGLLEQSNLFLGALCQNWGWPKSQNWFQKSGWDFCKTIQSWTTLNQPLWPTRAELFFYFGHFGRLLGASISIWSFLKISIGLFWKVAISMRLFWKKEILENIDIDKEIWENIESIRISNRATPGGKISK